MKRTGDVLLPIKSFMLDAVLILEITKKDDLTLSSIAIYFEDTF